MRFLNCLGHELYLGIWIACALLTACTGGKHSDQDWPRANLKAAPQQSDAAECRQFISALPADYVHDWLTVPEDPKNPTGPRVRIFYYGRISAGQTPILFLNGGPADNSHSSYRGFMDEKYAVADWSKAPFIFIDQRGTGCSSPYPQGDSDQITARLRLYGSSGIVADAEAVRQHLFGDRPWKVFGHSYGAWVVHRYLVNAPAGMVSGFAAANVVDRDPVERLQNRIFSQYRVLEEYFKRYPEDRASLEFLHRNLTTSTCFPSRAATPRRCGLAAIAPLVERIGFSNRWPWVHEWIVAMINYDEINTRQMNDFVNKLIFNNEADPSNRKSWPSAVITFFDRGLPQLDRPTCEQIFDQLRLQGVSPEKALLNECMVSLQFPDSVEQRIKRDQKFLQLRYSYGKDLLTIGQVSQSLAQNSGLQFWLYSGQLDSLVPVENFTQEVSVLGHRITYRNFEGSGHEGFLTQKAIAADVLK